MRLLTVVSAEGNAPLYTFFASLNGKQRQKLLSLFAMLLQAPQAILKEPYIKHFSLERYHTFYELRAKSKNLVRIIFVLTPEGDILFLVPFIKRRRRDTMQALEGALKLLDRLRSGSYSVQELSCGPGCLEL